MLTISHIMREYIISHIHENVADLALHRPKSDSMNEEEWRMCLQQIEGRQRMRHKLPEMVANPDWIFPPKLNLEQCSSQATAEYKQRLVQQLQAKRLTDLTGGFGIDFYYMSRETEEAHYVERNDSLYEIVTHNLTTVGGKQYRTYAQTAETYLQEHKGENLGLVYMDPARRSSTGSKVVLIEDCQPNVLQLLPQLKQQAEAILVKLSPMLDPTAAIRSLQGNWQTHIVGANGEVKEVLLLWRKGTEPIDRTEVVVSDVTQGVDLGFNRAEEQALEMPLTDTIDDNQYLYLPHSTLLKAGAYKTIANRYSIKAIDANSHLYISDNLLTTFPGRVFRIKTAEANAKALKGIQANVLTRNYVLGAEALRKQLRVKDGGKDYIIGTRCGGKPRLILAELNCATVDRQVQEQ